MPRTKKVAHKQAGRKPRETTTSYRTFQSVEAEDRYHNCISERTLWPEKGFLLQNTPTMGYEEYIYSVINKHNWQRFCLHPQEAVIAVVREFYAHLVGEGQRAVYVRGVQVPIDEDAINQCFDLVGVEDLHAEYAARAKDEWLEAALLNVCVPGTTWTVSTQGALTIPRASLTPQCKVWYHFLKTRLMPSTHVQTVSKDRVLLLDSVVSGRPIDVGRIIYQELGACASKKSGSLCFPSLITTLCERSGVPIFASEERLSSKGAINSIAVARLSQTKMAGGPSEAPRSDDDEAGHSRSAATNRATAASSSRDPANSELAQSLKLLEQRMSLAEVQQYQTMEMLQRMHSQQQQYWAYSKQRDIALKKSYQKNFTKPIFPFPEFPDAVLEPVIDEESPTEVDDDGEKD